MAQLTGIYALLDFSLIYQTKVVSGWIVAIIWIMVTFLVCLVLKKMKYVITFLICNIVFYSCIEGVSTYMGTLPIMELVASHGKIYIWNEVSLQWWFHNNTMEDKLRITQVMRHFFYNHCGDIPDYGPAVDKWVNSHVKSPNSGYWYTVDQLEQLAAEQAEPFAMFLKEFERHFIFTWRDFLNPSWLFIKFFKYYLKVKWPLR